MYTANNEILKTSENLFNIYKQCSHLSIKDSKAVAYTLEKTLRIASVSIRLASFIDSTNGIRNDIEKTSISLVKDAASFAHSSQARKSFESDIATLSALLTTAMLTGLLSQKNVSVLNDELSALITTTATIGTLTGRVYLDANELSVDIPQALFVREERIMSQSYQGHERDIARPIRSTQTGTMSERSYQTQGDGQQTKTARYSERVQEVQKDRRATILGLLQRKDRITVKDVANVVRDCSEKTIQRELAALVTQGVLKREGERRWSTYSLV